MRKHTKNLVQAFGFLSLDEADLIMQTAEKLDRKTVVVNIGAGVGTTALAVTEQRPDLIRYTIDYRDDDNPFGGLLNEINAFRNAEMPDQLPVQIKGDSSEVGRNWQGPKIDLLIIDADHTAEGLQKDIDAWVPHLSDSAFVAFHDYDSVNWIDVKNTVDKFAEDNPEYNQVGFADTMIVFQKGQVRKTKAEKPRKLSKG